MHESVKFYFAGCDPVEQSLPRWQDVRVPTPSKHSRDPILIALGSAIRANRKHIRMSQEQLAHIAGLDRSYVGQIERGENSVALHPLVKIARALGTSVSELCKEAGL